LTHDPSFARLVSLACHDLRTPLATVHGFARTLTKLENLDDPLPRYLGMIDAAALQLAALLDDLGLAARIAGGRYDPHIQEATTGELAEAAAAVAGEQTVAAGDRRSAVHVDVDAVTHALSAFAVCAVRHGGVQRVELRADGTDVTVVPVPVSTIPIVLGENLIDLGSAVGVRVVAAHGGAVQAEGEALRVRLPSQPPALDQASTGSAAPADS
jgi:signal transduction histidine kinase